MQIPQVVLDTNVLVAALRSARGASHRLLSRIGTGAFDLHLSVPLLFEYEDALARSEHGIPAELRETVLDYVCAVAKHQEIYFLWRPWLRDPGDDMVLEVAVAGGCSRIVTFNVADFTGIDRFNLRAVTPRTFLGELS